MECKFKYGRRIRSDRDGNIQWCELSAEEAGKALEDNVALNASIFRQCLHSAFTIVDPELIRPQSSDSEPQHLKAIVLTVAQSLFMQAGVKAFVALQERLDEKVHWHKAHGF